MLHGVGVRVPSAARKLEACSSYEGHAFLFLFIRNGKGNDTPTSPMAPVLPGKYWSTFGIGLQYFPNGTGYIFGLVVRLERELGMLKAEK